MQRTRLLTCAIALLVAFVLGRAELCLANADRTWLGLGSVDDPLSLDSDDIAAIVGGLLLFGNAGAETLNFLRLAVSMSGRVPQAHRWLVDPLQRVVAAPRGPPWVNDVTPGNARDGDTHAIRTHVALYPVLTAIVEHSERTLCLDGVRRWPALWSGSASASRHRT